jgi:3-hydroxy-D-aspartate aldolase
MRRRRGPPAASRSALGPNASLIGKRGTRATLWTPALLLDLDAFEHNIRSMSELCRKAGKLLRPHAKTHKSTTIARKQLEAGAIGIAVATVREAAAMIDAGIGGVLITSPIAGEAKLDAVARLAGIARGLMVVVDSLEGMQALEARMRRAGRTVGVLLDVDVGMKRTGVSDIRQAAKIAARLQVSGSLEFLGLQCYSGMIQHIPELSRRARTYRRELHQLENLIEMLATRGFTPRIVSGGGTGSFSIDAACNLFTECQAGSYVFMDLQYNAVELFPSKRRPFRTSLFVQSMVLSNNHAGAATLDAGFKSFALDGPVPVPVRGAPRGSTFQFYGDEFGMLRFPASGRRMRLGSKVEFVTPHCDPTVNLHDFYHCVRGTRLVDIWPVDARGAL